MPLLARRAASATERTFVYFRITMYMRPPMRLSPSPRIKSYRAAAGLGPTSEMGHYQRSNSALPLSALPPGADIAASACDVRKVPTPDSCTAACSVFIRSSRRRWRAPFRGQHLDAESGPRLLLAQIVCWVDVIDAPRPDELNLENSLLISGRGVVKVLCGIYPQGVRL